MDNIYNFGEILLELREKHGYTQKQLAQRLGLKNTTISKYETSNVPPPALMVRKIAKTFGVSSDYLLGIEPHGTISLYGLTSEQLNITTDLVEIFRSQNAGIKHKLSSEQFELLGRITANFTKK